MVPLRHPGSFFSSFFFELVQLAALIPQSLSQVTCHFSAGFSLCVSAVSLHTVFWAETCVKERETSPVWCRHKRRKENGVESASRDPWLWSNLYLMGSFTNRAHYKLLCKALTQPLKCMPLYQRFNQWFTCICLFHLQILLTHVIWFRFTFCVCFSVYALTSIYII